MRDRVEYGLRRTFEEIGEANVEFPLAEADGVVDGDEGIEADVHGRGGRAGPKFGVGFVEDFRQSRGHGDVRLARQYQLPVASGQLPVVSTPDTKTSFSANC